MSKLLIPILIGVAASALLIVLNLINRAGFADLLGILKSGLKDLIKYLGLSYLVGDVEELDLSGANRCESAGVNQKLDLSVLNCRVRLTKQQGKNNSDVFEVEICGSIHTPEDVNSATLKISIQDTTDKSSDSKPVRARIKKWQIHGSSEFRYSATLGKLPHKVTTISEWISIAQLPLNWLLFPRKGKRDLLFNTSIFSASSDKQLTSAQCVFTYDNSEFGYIDLRENVERTKTLTVAMAFAVSAADGKLYDCEIKLIKSWAKEHINLSESSGRAEQELDKALDVTVEFFRSGNQLNTYAICREIVKIASLADRYDILNLCLRVAQANGSVASEEFSILKNIATWLEVDMSRFRKMMEKVIPIDTLEVMDAGFVLGVTSDMSKEKARKQLNREYSKWSARVTNSDPEIQSQAGQMLKLIAEARSQYVG